LEHSASGLLASSVAHLYDSNQVGDTLLVGLLQVVLVLVLPKIEARHVASKCLGEESRSPALSYTHCAVRKHVLNATNIADKPRTMTLTFHICGGLTLPDPRSSTRILDPELVRSAV
jgi:hypothetical protein